MGKKEIEVHARRYERAGMPLYAKAVRMLIPKEGGGASLGSKGTKLPPLDNPSLRDTVGSMNKVETFIAIVGKDVHIVERRFEDRSLRVVAKCGLVGAYSGGDALKTRRPTCEDCLSAWGAEQFDAEAT